MVHLVLADDVARARVALEARLERPELSGQVLGAPPARAVRGDVRAIDDRARRTDRRRVQRAAGRPGAAGRVWVRRAAASRSARRLRARALSSSRLSLTSGGWMLFCGATWYIALASAPRSDGRCARSPMMALPMRTSRASGQRRIDVARTLHRGADVLAGDHLVEDGADASTRSRTRRPARAYAAARERGSACRSRWSARPRARCEAVRCRRAPGRSPTGGRRAARRARAAPADRCTPGRRRRWPRRATCVAPRRDARRAGPGASLQEGWTEEVLRPA